MTSGISLELLSYTSFNRDRATADSLKKVLIGYYSPTEISDSKKKLLSVSVSGLSDCPLKADRRKSSVRAAHEAEVDDIIGIFDVRSKELDDVQFAAVMHDRLPRYEPEEINICAVVDRQVRADAVLAELAATVALISAGDNTTSSLVTSGATLAVDRLESKIDTMMNGSVPR